MSGPIVRKYGFPNFEKIFGERGLQHGVEESGEAAQGSDQTAKPADPASNAPQKRPKPESSKKVEKP